MKLERYGKKWIITTNKIKKYERKDLEEAIKLFRKLAEKG